MNVVQKMKKIREVLIKLLGNVILLQDENDSDRFFPRFNLMKTGSFSQYDSSKHEVLKQLHDNYFYHSHYDLWTQSARKTLPVLMNATPMLMCGEDLGFVPSCVPPILGEMGVIGLRIQRMPGPEAPAGESPRILCLFPLFLRCVVSQQEVEASSVIFHIIVGHSAAVLGVHICMK